MTIATIALVLAATTTAFSLINAVSCRKVAAANPDRLVSITMTDADSGRPLYFDAGSFRAFQTQQTSFASMAMYSSGLYRVEAENGTVDVGGEGITDEYFQMLGTPIAAGRPLDHRDFRNGSETPAAVISNRLSQRLFARDAHAIGQTVKVDGSPAIIVGVTSGPFSGLQADSGTDVFFPLSFARRLANDHIGSFRALTLIGLRAPGVAIEQARAETAARWPAIQAATADVPASTTRLLRPAHLSVETLERGFSTLRRQWASAFSVVLGLTSILLAISCVNLMGLMLARSMSYRQETSLRSALGASHGRLIRQHLIDGLLLAFSGLAIALPLAWWSSELVTATLTVARTIPLQRAMVPDARVLGVAIAMAVGMGLLIGLLPALRLARTGRLDPPTQARGLARTLGYSGRAVLGAQVVLSMVLLVGAGLLAETLSHLRFNHSQLDTATVLFTRLARNPGDRGQLAWPYFQKLLDELSTSPSIESVAMSSSFPAYTGFVGSTPVETFQRDQESSGSVVSAAVEFVTPRFFETYGLRRLSGRDFSWSDSEKSPEVAILSQGMAEKVFPAGNAVGQRVRLLTSGTAKSLEVVGVVVNAPMGNIREPDLPVVFRPLMQGLSRAQSPMTHARVRGDPGTVRETYTRIVEAQGHHFVRGLFTINDWLDNALLQERLMTGVSTSASVLAAFLACLGVYGLVSYSLAARMKEIGVRLSLGATRGNIAGMVVGETLAIVGPGILIGLPCAVGVAGLVRSQLHGVEPADPVIMAAAAVAFTITGILASLLPALKASRTDPIDALRR